MSKPVIRSKSRSSITKQIYDNIQILHGESVKLEEDLRKSNEALIVLQKKYENSEILLSMANQKIATLEADNSKIFSEFCAVNNQLNFKNSQPESFLLIPFSMGTGKRSRPELNFQTDISPVPFPDKGFEFIPPGSNM